MTTRRDFLQMALTAPLLPASLRLPSSDGPTDSLSAHAQAQIGSLYTVLCDERFPESVAFAEEMSRCGTPVTRFRGDITDFWYRDLSQRWKADSVAIAGVTTHGPLFCLERWGWDHGLRISERQDLPVAGDHETLIRWVIAPYRRNVRT
jgi:hypothetical protein